MPVKWFLNIATAINGQRKADIVPFTVFTLAITYVTLLNRHILLDKLII